MGEDTEDNAAEDKATDQEEDVDMEDDEGVSEADKRIDVAPEGVTHPYNRQADDSLSATITTVNTMNGEDDDNEDGMEEVTDLFLIPVEEVVNFLLLFNLGLLQSWVMQVRKFRVNAPVSVPLT